METRIFLVLLLMHFWVVRAHATQECIGELHGKDNLVSVHFKYYDETVKHRRQIELQLFSTDLNQIDLPPYFWIVSATTLWQEYLDCNVPGSVDVQLFSKRIQV